MATRFSTFTDPWDLDTYFLQRMNEFFGPDFERVFPPATVRPERATRPTRGWIEEAQEEESAEVEEEPELTRRQLRRMRKRLQLDIVETDDAYFVEVNMPGVPKENVEVHVDHNNVLSIETRAVPLVTHTCGSQAFKRSTKEPQQGEAGAISTPTESPSKEAKKEEEQQGQPTESHNRKFLLSERQKGRMSRSIRLPKQADPEKVQTCLENGVLCLVFAKLPEHQVAHRIEVK